MTYIRSRVVAGGEHDMEVSVVKAVDRSVAPYAPAADCLLTLSQRLFDVKPFCSMDDAEFELRFLEQVVADDPCCEDALIRLGAMYSRGGDYLKGLDVDRRLVRLRPRDATAHYNLACSYALLDDLDEALAAMERAVRLGYRDMGHMLKDPDLANLRKDARFRKLMGRVVEAAIRKS